MSICLSHLSADVALEHIAKDKHEVGPASPDPSSFVADPAAIESALGNLADKLPRPIEVVVNDARRRRHASGVACHVWNGSLLQNSILAIGEGLYVASPEFVLAQQSSQLHQVSLCKLLGRYLGTWSPLKDESGEQFKRAPLTSFDALNAFLLEAGRFRGKDSLKLAMAYTCDGAASAPETSLQLALCLPPELHGLNLEQPIMNYEVNLSTEARTLYPADSIRIDLCWHNKKFGLEYQGSEHGNRLGADYARSYAAHVEGYELLFAAKEQLASAEQMFYIAGEVAKHIESDVDTALWPTEDELQELLDILDGRKHPKPLTNAELRERRACAKARQRGARSCGSAHLPTEA